MGISYPGEARQQSRSFAVHHSLRDTQAVGSEKTLTKKPNIGSIGDMKSQTTVLILALCFFGAALSFADDSLMGTWKLNETKSKFTAEANKNHTVVYETVGENVKITVDGKDKDGKSTHNEWSGKFDGKDYAVTGDPTSDTRSYKKVNDHTLAMTVKKDGKVTSTGQVVVSADGKSRVVSTSGTDSGGKKVSNKVVYDKQQ